MEHDTDNATEHARNYFQEAYRKMAPLEELEMTAGRVIDSRKEVSGKPYHTLAYWGLYASHCLPYLYRRNLRGHIKSINEMMLLNIVEDPSDTWHLEHGLERVIANFLQNAPQGAIHEEYGITEDALRRLPVDSESIEGFLKQLNDGPISQQRMWVSEPTR